MENTESMHPRMLLDGKRLRKIGFVSTYDAHTTGEQLKRRFSQYPDGDILVLVGHCLIGKIVHRYDLLTEYLLAGSVMYRRVSREYFFQKMRDEYQNSMKG